MFIINKVTKKSKGCSHQHTHIPKQVQVQWTSRIGRRPWMWISQCMCVCLLMFRVLSVAVSKKVQYINIIRLTTKATLKRQHGGWLGYFELKWKSLVPFSICVCVYMCDCPIRTIEHVVAWSLTRSLLSVCVVCVCIVVSALCVRSLISLCNFHHHFF